MVFLPFLSNESAGTVFETELGRVNVSRFTNLLNRRLS